MQRLSLRQPAPRRLQIAPPGLPALNPGGFVLPVTLHSCDSCHSWMRATALEQSTIHKSRTISTLSPRSPHVYLAKIRHLVTMLRLRDVPQRSADTPSGAPLPTGASRF